MDYISEKLQNLQAAIDLVDAVEQVIKERLPVAESFEPFRSVRERSHLYYRIFVKNITIFYVVIEDVMEMRRILYSRRDLEKWISL